MDYDDTMRLLITEARRQNRQPLIDRILKRFGYMDGWFVLKGEIVRHRPFRWIWQIKCAWLLHRQWNAPHGHVDRSSLWGSWQFAGGIVELLDESGEGYMSPSEAIHSDSEHWESD